MELVISNDVIADLETVYNTVGINEFSGMGKVQRMANSLFVYQWTLLNVGSPNSTIITPEDTKELSPNTPFLEDQWRVWIHSHPIGNGKPGPQCWSPTDEIAISETPLGTVPLIAQWSVSLVRTPGGYAARLDTYNPQKTIHLDVVPNLVDRIAEVKAMTPAPDPWVFSSFTETRHLRSDYEFAHNKDYMPETDDIDFGFDQPKQPGLFQKLFGNKE